MRALERTVAYARAAGLLVVLDAKRGDVPHTAEAYARAWLGADADSGAGADALTVNISIGPDSLDSLAGVALARNCQLYALVHTSNPGAADFQRITDAHGTPWWHVLATAVEDAGVGAVVGATHPEVLAEARKLMPTAPLLLPGVGAQGAAASDLAVAVTPSAPPPLVAAARSLLPMEPVSGAAFREHVARQARGLAEQTASLIREPAV